MKKLLYLFGLLFLTSAIFTSCNDDDVAVTDVALNRDRLTLVPDETFRLTAMVLPSNASNPNLVWTSDDPEIAAVDDNGVITAVSGGTTTIRVVANRAHAASCVVTVVDGVRIENIIWATRNVDRPGTFAENPEDAGMFFQWNRRVGWSSTNPMVNSNGGTIWDSSVPTGTTWLRENDPCPEGWRVPTREELNILRRADYYWITRNGVNGKNFGTSSNYIFLPAAGWRNASFDGALAGVNVRGSYGCSTPTNDARQISLSFTSSSLGLYNGGKTNGMSIRCVAR